MEAIVIHSRLKHFRLITRITQVDTKSIQGQADFIQIPAFCALEAMAQLAALHVRHNLRFQRHAFLLKVSEFQWPAKQFLEGCCRISAGLSSQGSDAFAYHVEAVGPENEKLNAGLIIGTKAYDEVHKQEILQRHYRDLFHALKTAGRDLEDMRC